MTNSDKEVERLEIDEISKRASQTALAAYPRRQLSWGMRILTIVVALFIAGNGVISVYNSLAVRREIACIQQISNALNKVTSQNRDINRHAIDLALGGSIKTQKQATALKDEYDAQFDANTVERKKVLDHTCKP